jgi:ribulose-phosphate 3-epimerase
MTSVRIAPSLLAANPLHLDRDIKALDLGPEDWLHVDVMDGHFVPRINFSDLFVGALHQAYSPVVLDVHLMISPADPHIHAYAHAGADIITVHPEADPDVLRTLHTIRSLGKKAGIALNPATSEDCLTHILDSIDLVLVMTVCPGAGGQKFLSSMLPKITRVREIIGDRPINLSVDGGIAPENAGLVTKAGANVLVAGSSLFGDIKHNMAALQNAISRA